MVDLGFMKLPFAGDFSVFKLLFLFYCWIGRFTFGFEPVTQTGTASAEINQCVRPAWR